MKAVIQFLFIIFFTTTAFAQTTKDLGADSIMITVFLKHQQDKSLAEIQKKQEENKLWDMFPPKQARVVSWYVMMGIGQVVTLKITPKDLRTLNLSIEKGAWGAFSTEFYPTYDYVPVYKEMMEKRAKTNNQ
ncbi:hypothetical protein [Segetibacter koreensis]|uniref:hypothetical protein n=1 Tax=Segetibacter koreensis TaxID=398037 RepID=UPI00036C270E|nr:hypothetical protein [Segetibacter koreensis]